MIYFQRPQQQWNLLHRPGCFQEPEIPDFSVSINPFETLNKSHFYLKKKTLFSIWCFFFYWVSLDKPSYKYKIRKLTTKPGNVWVGLVLDGKIKGKLTDSRNKIFNIWWDIIFQATSKLLLNLRFQVPWAFLLSRSGTIWFNFLKEIIKTGRRRNLKSSRIWKSFNEENISTFVPQMI